DPVNASIVYAGTSRGIYKSTDAGTTWHLANNGLSNTSVSALATDHVTAGRLIAGTFSAPDGFVAKLNPAGSALAFSTYLGGGNSDYIYGLALDGSGNIYLAGATNSIDFPVVQAWDPAHPGSDADGFVSKLSGTGDHLIYSTYLGGQEDDFANAVTIDSAGNAYVAGTTRSNDFPLLGALQNSLSGPSDA